MRPGVRRIVGGGELVCKAVPLDAVVGYDVIMGPTWVTPGGGNDGTVKPPWVIGGPARGGYVTMEPTGEVGVVKEVTLGGTLPAAGDGKGVTGGLTCVTTSTGTLVAPLEAELVAGNSRKVHSLRHSPSWHAWQRRESCCSRGRPWRRLTQRGGHRKL